MISNAKQEKTFRRIFVNNFSFNSVFSGNELNELSSEGKSILTTILMRKTIKNKFNS